MAFMRNIQKFCSGNWFFCLIGVVVLAVAINTYSKSKGLLMDGMGNRVGESEPKNLSESSVQPSQPLGENGGFANVSGRSSMPGLPPSCNKQSMQNPEALLPNDSNNEWARLNPSGSGQLNGVNLLQAGHHIGIDTVGQSLRNPNLQVRSEPPNPQLNVGPWNNTTMEPDTMQVPLELGCGSV